jgi:hypothetical protein
LPPWTSLNTGGAEYGWRGAQWAAPQIALSSAARYLSYLDTSRAHGGVAWTAQFADAACRPDPHVAEFRGRDAIVCLRNQLASWPRVTVRLRPTLAADVLAARSSRECFSRSLSARRVSCGVAARAPPILDRLRCDAAIRRDSPQFRRGPFLCSALIGRRSISNNGRSLRRARAQTRPRPPAIGPETNDKKILCIPAK